MISQSKRRQLAVFFTVAGIVAAVIWIFALRADTSGASISFLNVGQGDAALIQMDGNIEILIDGGPDASVVRELGARMHPADRTVDIIILTHPESDHMTGLIDVVEHYSVGAVVMTGVLYDTALYKTFLRAVEERGIPVVIAQKGMKIKTHAGELSFLTPQAPLFGLKLEHTNNTSIVAEFHYGETSVLFSGDIDTIIENQLMEKGALSDIDILKVAHHGSKTASSETFLTTVRPEIAVISVGESNRYQHPHSETLDRLSNAGAEILRTDNEETIRFSIDKHNFHRIQKD